MIHTVETSYNNLFRYGFLAKQAVYIGSNRIIVQICFEATDTQITAFATNKLVGLI